MTRVVHRITVLALTGLTCLHALRAEAQTSVDPASLHAVLLEADRYRSRCLFAEAAEAYERYAARFAEHGGEFARLDPEVRHRAADAMRSAMIFRIGLGEHARALEDATEFERMFRRMQGFWSQVDTVTVAIGGLYRDQAVALTRRPGGSAADRARRRASVRAAWLGAVRHYTRFIAVRGVNTTLDLRIQANRSLGRACWHLGDLRCAIRHLRAASAPIGLSWPDECAQERCPDGESQIYRELGDDRGSAAVEAAREAAAEARFLLAEIARQRDATRGLTLPPDAPTRQAFERWTEHAVL